MKRMFLSFLLLCCITSINAQVNRYDRGSNYEYIDQYVSTDFDFLLNAAKISRNVREAQKQTLELINEIESIYNSYTKYPNPLYNGWHDVICITTASKRIYQMRAYTNNSIIRKIYFDNEITESKDIPVIDGIGKTPDLKFYFLRDIKEYNSK